MNEVSYPFVGTGELHANQERPDCLKAMENVTGTAQAPRTKPLYASRGSRRAPIDASPHRCQPVDDVRVSIHNADDYLPLTVGPISEDNAPFSQKQASKERCIGRRCEEEFAPVEGRVAHKPHAFQVSAHGVAVDAVSLPQIRGCVAISIESLDFSRVLRFPSLCHEPSIALYVHQCVDAGLPFFFKGWGGPTPKSGGRLLDGREWNGMPCSGP